MGLGSRTYLQDTVQMGEADRQSERGTHIVYSSYVCTKRPVHAVPLFVPCMGFVMLLLTL